MTKINLIYLKKAEVNVSAVRRTKGNSRKLHEPSLTAYLRAQSRVAEGCMLYKSKNHKNYWVFEKLWKHKKSGKTINELYDQFHS